MIDLDTLFAGSGGMPILWLLIAAFVFGLYKHYKE